MNCAIHAGFLAAHLFLGLLTLGAALIITIPAHLVTAAYMHKK